MSMEWHRRNYGVPVRRGRQVIFDGKPGRITSAPDNYLRIQLDEGGSPLVAHPRWRVTYLDAGKPMPPLPVGD